MRDAHRKQSPRRWIAYQKRKWRVKAAQRKKRCLDAAKARYGDQPTQQAPSAFCKNGLSPYAVHLLRQHAHAAVLVMQDWLMSLRPLCSLMLPS